MVESFFNGCKASFPPLIEDNSTPPPFQVDYSSQGSNWENICASSSVQSPINIETSSVTKGDSEISFEHLSSIDHFKNFTVFNVVRYDNLDNFLLTNFTTGGLHKFWQYHFHTPAEHTVDGKLYDAEVHFVFYRLSDPSQLLVVGVLLELAEESDSDIIEETLDVHKFLGRAGSDYWHYQGSLTTPPCSEGVQWVVMQKPLQISHKSWQSLNSHMGESNREI